jgi:peptide deformylase
MSILKVARLGHPVLSLPADPVDPADLPRLRQLIDDMVETMRDERGVGLAGPQVHTSLRLFVMDPGDEHGGLQVVVNPVLHFPEPEKIRMWEGCLSIPGVRGLTERFDAVNVTCLDRDGRERELSFRGFPAVVVQHETDHLDGKLFLERMPDLSKITFEEEYARFHAPAETAAEDASDGEGNDEEHGDGPET